MSDRIMVEEVVLSSDDVYRRVYVAVHDESPYGNEHRVLFSITTTDMSHNTHFPAVGLRAMADLFSKAADAFDEHMKGHAEAVDVGPLYCKEGAA